MRCFNCGWDNSPGSSACIKCGQALGNNYSDNTAIQSAQNTLQNTPVSRPTAVYHGEDLPASRTPYAQQNAQSVPVSRPTAVYPAGGISSDRVTSIQQITKCPNCGYPVADKFESCPSCGMSLKKAARTATEVKQQQQDFLLENQNITCQECGQEVAMSSTFCPYCGQRLHKPTIRRQIKHTVVTEQEPQPKCSLEMVPEEGEYVDTLKKDFEGKSIILNRENTDSNNRTITSKEQAELIYEDGHWYLIDKSELQTTYIQATRKIELQPDDIIVLGDRRFKFIGE